MQHKLTRSSPRPAGLRSRLLDLDLTGRIGYDAERNALFLNFEGLTVRRPDDVLAIERAVANRAFYDASGAERAEAEGRMVYARSSQVRERRTVASHSSSISARRYGRGGRAAVVATTGPRTDSAKDGQGQGRGA